MLRRTSRPLRPCFPVRFHCHKRKLEGAEVCQREWRNQLVDHSGVQSFIYGRSVMGLVCALQDLQRKHLGSCKRARPATMASRCLRCWMAKKPAIVAILASATLPTHPEWDVSHEMTMQWT